MNKKIMTVLGMFVLLIVVIWGGKTVFDTKQTKTTSKPKEATANSVKKEKQPKEAKEIKKVKKDNRFILVNSTTLKNKPEEDAKDLKHLIAGTVVELNQEAEDWLKVKFTDEVGYVLKKDTISYDSFKNDRQKIERNQNKQEFKENLTEALTSYQNEKGGDISLYYIDLESGTEFSFDGTKNLQVASSIKLPLVTQMMEKIERKEVNLEDTLTYTGNYYNDGSGIIKHDPVGSTYSIEKLAELSIKESDNIAYKMLLNEIGEGQFVSYMNQIGQAPPRNINYSNARELAYYMKHVYDHSAENEMIKKMKDWLENTSFNEGIPLGVPTQTVAHKAGWMPMYQVSNDIALIEDERPYVLSVMTNGYTYEYSKTVLKEVTEIVDEAHLATEF